jgi:hypothetical protein
MQYKNTPIALVALLRFPRRILSYYKISICEQRRRKRKTVEMTNKWKTTSNLRQRHATPAHRLSGDHILSGPFSLCWPFKMTLYLPLDVASPFPQSPSFLLPSPDLDDQLNKVIKAIMKARRIVVICGMILRFSATGLV